MNNVKNKTYFIKTYGCAYNKVDSQIIKDILEKSNFIEFPIEKSNFIIINTCAVKGVTENRIMHELKNLSQNYKTRKIVITGCLPQISKSSLIRIIETLPTFSAIVDVNNIHKINVVLEEILRGKKNIIKRSEKKIDKSKFLLNYPENNITAIIPIAEGCLGNCTYCCVKNSRGKLCSFDSDNILNHIKNQLERKKKEIFLTAQDCSCYYYNGLNLIGLLKKILTLNQKFYLRIGMINPNFFINFSEDFIELYQNKKLYKFIHIPIQSGSDNILQRMSRDYEIQTLKDSIKNLRKKISNISIETDVICGFPGETQLEFNKTISLINWLKPEILNISKFSPRPGTFAKEMKQVKSELIKKRSKKLSNLYKKIKLFHIKKWKHWKGEILITKKVKNDLFLGKNIYYIPIFTDKGKIGEFKNIKVEKMENLKLFGKVI